MQHDRMLQSLERERLKEETVKQNMRQQIELQNKEQLRFIQEAHNQKKLLRNKLRNDQKAIQQFQESRDFEHKQQEQEQLLIKRSLNRQLLIENLSMTQQLRDSKERLALQERLAMESLMKIREQQELQREQELQERKKRVMGILQQQQLQYFDPALRKKESLIDKIAQKESMQDSIFNKTARVEHSRSHSFGGQSLTLDLIRQIEDKNQRKEIKKLEARQFLFCIEFAEQIKAKVQQDHEQEVYEQQARRTQAKSYFQQLIKQIQDKERTYLKELSAERSPIPEQPKLNTIDFSELSPSSQNHSFQLRRKAKSKVPISKMTEEEVRLNRKLLQEAREYKQRMNQTGYMQASPGL